jgi:hypothetical protein
MEEAVPTTCTNDIRILAVGARLEYAHLVTESEESREMNPEPICPGKYECPTMSIVIQMAVGV